MKKCQLVRLLDKTCLGKLNGALEKVIGAPLIRPRAVTPEEIPAVAATVISIPPVCESDEVIG